MNSHINELTCLHYSCHDGALADIVETIVDIGGTDLVMFETHYCITDILHACERGASL